MSLNVVCHNKVDQLLKAIAEGKAMDKNFSPDTPREQLLAEIAKLKLAGIGAASADYASKAELNKLKGQVTQLEESNKTVVPKIEELESAKTDFTSRIQTLETFKSDNTPKIQALETFKSDVTPKIQALETFKSDVTPRVSNLESAKSTIEQGIEDLKRRVAALEGAGGA